MMEVETSATSAEKISAPTIQINRQAYKQSEFDDEFLLKSPKTKKSLLTASLFKWLDPTKFLNVFTVLNLVTEYNFKRDLVADIFSGKIIQIS